MARNDISFTGQLRNPEAMDDIVREKINMHYRTYRSMQRIGSSKVIILIVELPPPLMPNCTHYEWFACWLCCHLVQALNSKEQHNEEYDRRDDRPYCLNLQIAMDLPRVRHPWPLTEADNG